MENSKRRVFCPLAPTLEGSILLTKSGPKGPTEKYEYDPAIRDVAAGLNSYETARRWIAKSEWQHVSKRTKTILSDQCKRDRQMYCQENWDNDFKSDMHGDESSLSSCLVGRMAGTCGT